MTPAQARAFGEAAGDEAARRAIGVLARTDDGPAFKREFDARLEGVEAEAARMSERGVPAGAVAAYREGWNAAFEALLDRVIAMLLPCLPDDPDEDDDDDGPS